MTGNLFSFCSVFFFAQLFCTAVSGNDGSVQNQQRFFTNQDLEQYKFTSDYRSEMKNDFQAVPDEKAGRRERILKEREKEYWCKKGSEAKKKIEKAEHSVALIEKEISIGESKTLKDGRKDQRLKKDLKKAGRQLTDAKVELDEIENEAHRKGVPPGWLRCQI
jgi:hypothetical protein